MLPRPTAEPPESGSPIAITGMGAVSALGESTSALWSAIEEGRDGIRPIERFSTEGFSVSLGGMVPGAGTGDRCVEFATAAAREALAHAALQIGPGGVAGRRVALILGTSLGMHVDGLHRVAAEVARALGIEGPTLTLSTACSSSTNAIGLGRDLLEAGLCDIALAGGTDELTPEIFAGFHALGLLCLSKCAPFSEPVGTTLGEGAGFLVLERGDTARARGAQVLATVLGYGLSADAYHPTTPDPTGAGVARALRGALLDARMEADRIDYFNAHGTGTMTNDAAEFRALEQVFGERVARLPVSSTKSFLGHAQGAAGVLELIATLCGIAQGKIPPTLHYDKARPRSPPDPVAGDRPRVARVERALCNNSAFGGANAAVIVGKVPNVSAGKTPTEWLVLGASAVGPHGMDLDALGEALAAKVPLRRRAPAFRIESLIPTADGRGMDPASRYLSAAATLALADAGITLRGAKRDRAGLFVGTTRASTESEREFRDSIRERGLARLSATAFTRMVLNASAGTCTKLCALKGPTTTLTTGDGSGLVALIYAALHLSTRSDVDLILAAGVDERVSLESEAHEGEGAACLVLGKGPAPDTSKAVRLSGFGLAGPGDVEEATRLAIRMAGLDASDVVVAPNVAPVLGPAPAAAAMFACAFAVASILRGTWEHVLVPDAGGTAAAAVVFSRKGAA
ncbi:beta-ketoacyl synthase N-terminal-like domain-containing protein [Polyangium sorediatum]|uniref:Beta-ketoacyl-[acyl-carrier-protein] synthase family protein n=1 Tax=Polyangium sorediatum TaxID=889274 RepID=A0ABT6NTR3_9BACT|nr:beta-ketoacyl-[acyl-carrier-protein] synthase family protein [Polyangium sorediatum]MDI1431683.1 beta-ketoacyl-[acyl-carrier-protein] synthase family protein [Polyangium sorediatum]